MTAAMRVRPFAFADGGRWDALVAESHGATFLHSRRFLSYHGDRFADRSLVIEGEDGRWLGLLPAALVPGEPGVVGSHPGLTYGGLLHAGALRGAAMLQAFEAVRAHQAAEGLKTLRYKPVPRLYHRAPAEDDLYALFRLGARRTRCDLSSSIDLAHPLATSDRRRRSLKKALAADLVVEQGSDHLPELWAVLEAKLAARHDARPVHSLDEIRLLAERFPAHIRTVVARHEKQVVAGTVLFIDARVVHTQYIASNDAGQALGALDLVFRTQIEAAVESGSRYFDFGISNEDQGRTLNEGLHRFKSEFGAGGAVHEFYEVDL